MSEFKKTPGVYIEERSVFGNSVVPVATAIPAFVGYTAKAESDGKSLKNKLVKITSLVDFVTLFGNNYSGKFNISPLEDPTKDEFDLLLKGQKYEVTPAEGNKMFYLFNCIRLFYANGGADAYVVSVGSYDDEINKDALIAGVDLLKKEDEITMILAPDSLNLTGDPGEDGTFTYAPYFDVVNHAMEQCLELKSRVTLIDFPDAAIQPSPITAWENEIEKFQEGIGKNPETTSYGISYYPWLETVVAPESEVTFSSIDAATDLKAIIDTSPKGIEDALNDLVENRDSESPDLKKYHSDEKKLLVLSRDYKQVIAEIRKKVNLLPPCSAMAGVYAKVDDQRGVWKAPANLGLNSVIKPHVKIDDKLQENLNIPINGKAINIIRSFQGRGSAWVWGARTLDGNSNDWRYINVRRLFLFLEQSIKSATFPFVFEPNDANTWNTLSSMISNFLTGVWKAGGLVGSTPESAFQVLVGLGVTMTYQDILDGYLRVTVKVAPSRPAEFIVITFEQKMQEA
ncbi:MAG: phage tail sheath C-terminal domain-containing protein [Bacteroidota bacterium]